MTQPTAMCAGGAVTRRREEEDAGRWLGDALFHRSLTNWRAKSNSLPFSSAITTCRSSFFLAETRSSSPWTWARTPFGPSSRMIFDSFLALSWLMPSLRATASRYSLPESLGSAGSRVLSDTPRLTSLSLNTSRTAIARSSLLARMSTACSPDQAMDAPTPRKSNRVPISLAAWLSALSASWRSSLDTMSKEDSWDATAPRLDVPAGGRHIGRAGGRSDHVGLDGPSANRLVASWAILFDAARADGTRQVARVAKGSGL